MMSERLIREVLERYGPLTQVGIAKVTRIPRGEVTRIVDTMFLADDLVAYPGKFKSTLYEIAGKFERDVAALLTLVGPRTAKIIKTAIPEATAERLDDLVDSTPWLSKQRVVTKTIKYDLYVVSPTKKG